MQKNFLFSVVVVSVILFFIFSFLLIEAFIISESLKINKAKASSYGPTVLYTDILSGPNTGGENNNGVYLSIFGTGFGASQGSSKVYINNTEVADYKYWGVSQHGRSDIQQITVQPGASVSSGSIKVVVGGKSSNTNHSFAVRSGDIYFVDNVDGNQTAGEIGNINKPFRYIQETFDRSDFGPGDTIVMRGKNKNWNDVGDADRFLYFGGKSGASNNRLKIIGYPGEDVNVVYTNHFVIQGHGGSNYWDISNIYFDVAGEEWSTINVFKSSNIRLVNCEHTGMNGQDSGHGVIAIGTGNNRKVYGNYIHDAGSTHSDHYIRKLFHGIYADAGYGDNYNLDIGWNRIQDISGGRGIQIFHGSNNIYNVEIHDNFISRTWLDNIILSGVPSSGMKVYNNILSEPGQDPEGEDGRCLDLRASDMDVEVYQNTLYASGSRNGAFGFYRLSSANLKNNIIYVDNSAPYFQGNETPSASNNIWYGNGAPPSWDTNPLNLNPEFMSVGSNYHLQSDSPAIDTGVNLTSISRDFEGNLRPQNSNYDMGAYEYAGTAPSTYCGDGSCNGSETCSTCPSDCGECSSCADGETRSCDTGLQGICSEGTQTCSNGDWGTCEQNNQSTTEICGDGIDQDCDGSDLSCDDPSCGDGTCDTGETCSSCPSDCGECSEDSSLIAYYKFNEGSGSTVNDFSGNENHGTLNSNPVWTAGKFNQALSFDGNDDYVDYGDLDQIDGLSAITVSAWVNVDELSSVKGKDQHILYKWGSVWLYLNDEKDRFYFNLKNSNGSNDYAASDILASANQWYHVVGNWDGDNGNLWINGEKQTNWPISLSGSLDSNSYDFIVGARSYYHDKTWDGKIDDLRIYNRALSEAEIQNLYNQTEQTHAQGDLNQDGQVNSMDWSQMRSHWFTNNTASDLNNDGTVNSLDFSIMNQNWTG